MPACFQLIPRGETQALSLAEIDNRMRRDLGAPADPKRYLREWFDSIGFSLACGKTWEELREHYAPGQSANADWERHCAEMLEVVEWLAARFDAKHWHER